MNILIKYALLSLGGLILILLAVILLLPLFLDPNDYTDQIIELVRERTGHELTIEQEMSLSVFPWVGVETGTIILASPAEFDGRPLLKFTRAELKMELLPLFSGQINIKQARLYGLQINLITNIDGISNWEGPDSPNIKAVRKKIPLKFSNPDLAPGEKPHFQLSTLRVDSIAINHGQLNWQNELSGHHLEMQSLLFDMDRFKFDSAIDFSVKGKLHDLVQKSSTLTNATGRIIVEPGFNVFKLERFDMKAEYSKKSGVSPFRYELGATAILNIDKQTLVFFDLDLTSADAILHTEISSTQIFETPVLSGPVTITRLNLRQLAKEFGKPFPNTKDPQALTDLSGSFKVKSTSSRININNISLTLDNSTLKGAASLKNFVDPAITVNLNSDYFDLSRYLPDSARSTNTEPKQNSPKPSHSEDSQAVRTDSFPIDAIRNLNLYGIFNIRKLAFEKMEAERVQLTIKSNNLVIRSNQRIKNFYNGRFRGAVEFNFQGQQPVVSMYEMINNVSLGPMLNGIGVSSRISGTADVKLRLVGRGNNIEDIKSTLNGDISGKLINGHLQGLNIAEIAAEIPSVSADSINQTAKPTDRTDFSSLQFTAAVTNGIMNNSTLKAVTSGLEVDGNGEMNLKNNILDYHLSARFTDEAPLKIKELKGADILIRVSGTPSQLTYQPDVKQTLKQIEVKKAKPEVKKALRKLKKSFSKKLEPEVSDMLNDLF